MADKRAEIVKLLDRRTQSGQLKWEIGQDARISTQIGHNKVVLREVKRPIDDPDYVVSIINPDGQSVEQFSDVDLYNSTGDVWFSIMQALYVAGRRSALGVDKIFDDLISNLSKDE